MPPCFGVDSGNLSFTGHIGPWFRVGGRGPSPLAPHGHVGMTGVKIDADGRRVGVGSGRGEAR